LSKVTRLLHRIHTATAALVLLMPSTVYIEHYGV